MAEFKTILYELIGNKVRELRKLKGWSQEDLAKQINVARSTIANIEMGNHQAPLHTLYSVFYFLGADIHHEMPTYHQVLAILEKNSPSRIVDELSEKLPETAKGDLENILKFLNKTKTA